MKSRSPLLGYNHNIRYGGRRYHVQTEDSGVQNPHIFTHLFHEGTILASKRFDYDPDSDDGVVQKLMQAQHKAMLKALKAGEFDAKIEQFFGEPVVRDEGETIRTGRADEPIETTTPEHRPFGADDGIDVSLDWTPYPSSPPPSSPALPSLDELAAPLPPPLPSIASQAPAVPVVVVPAPPPVVIVPAAAAPVAAKKTDPLADTEPNAPPRGLEDDEQRSPPRRPSSTRPAVTGAGIERTPSRPSLPIRRASDRHPVVPPSAPQQPPPARPPSGPQRPPSRPVIPSVIARPTVVVGGAPPSPPRRHPTKPAGHPVQPPLPPGIRPSRATTPMPVAPPSANPFKGPTRLGNPFGVRPATETIFGEDPYAEKSLDDVILAYLAEDLPEK